MYRAVVLQPEYEGNIGAIARLVENFGIDELCLVDPQCDIGGEAEQRAAHATDRLRGARVVDDLGPVIDDLDYLIGTTGIKAGEENVLRHGSPPRTVLDGIPADADVGLLLGREGTGLSNAELDRCDAVVTVQTTDDYPVMNLSHAAAVLFHELHRAERGGAGASSRERRAALDNLFKRVIDSLDWDETRSERTVRAFRNVLGRAYVTDRELQLLLGAFRETRDALGDG
ncbi:MAG: TrmJ/YjtD family RNA methyltransferase [Candidatus Nanohaloarchaea archaeon]|nr:TrmJ/YjtD family RNA methyltransferase [Candidatus Nanohaloarchaea archaeon]